MIPYLDLPVWKMLFDYAIPEMDVRSSAPWRTDCIVVPDLDPALKEPFSREDVYCLYLLSQEWGLPPGKPGDVWRHRLRVMGILKDGRYFYIAKPSDSPIVGVSRAKAVVGLNIALFETALPEELRAHFKEAAIVGGRGRILRDTQMGKYLGGF